MTATNFINNLQTRIIENPYPGRGIILGKNEEGRWCQVYWIMGRSENSRNRIFKYEDDVLHTEAAEPSKVKDPSLIIYNAMRVENQQFVVTNGSQTDVIVEGLRKSKTFQSALLSQKHEPDTPNFTPRISGYLDLRDGVGQAWLSIIKASPLNSDHSEYHFFHYPYIPSGYGYAVTTYQNDGNPLPPFEGAPMILELQGNAAQIAQTYWNALNDENKISIAVLQIHPTGQYPEVFMINKYCAA
ncbi:IMP cyclohydrolase [Deltaproteobacteria bacterium TL4]